MSFLYSYDRTVENKNLYTHKIRTVDARVTIPTHRCCEIFYFPIAVEYIKYISSMYHRMRRNLTRTVLFEKDENLEKFIEDMKQSLHVNAHHAERKTLMPRDNATLEHDAFRSSLLRKNSRDMFFIESAHTMTPHTDPDKKDARNA